MAGDGERVASTTRINLSDVSAGRDINIIEKIVNVIKQPPLWQDAIWGFLSQNRVYLLIAVVLQIALAAVYFRFQNLYLIPLWLWAVAVALLFAATWSWYRWDWSGRLDGWFGAAFVGTMALALLGGRQVQMAISPEPFPLGTFGVAVSELGEGSRLWRTNRAREISAQVFATLCQELGDSLAKDASDPCDSNAEANSLETIALKRLGVVPDKATARRMGDLVGADIVIWGQLLTSVDGGAVIRFQVLETPDRAVNPEFPLVLPTSTKTTEIYASELELNTGSVVLKDIVAGQTAVMAAFTLGLVDYLNVDYPQAINRLATAAQLVRESGYLESSGTSLIQYYLGKSQHALGLIEEGQATLETVRDADMDEAAVPLSLALGYRSLGQLDKSEIELDEAFDRLERWLSTHPEDAAALYDRGIAHTVRGEYESAIFDYRRAIESKPDFYIARISLGQGETNAGRLNQAEETLQTAIEQAVTNGANPAWAHINLAQVYEKMDQPRLANEQYIEATKNAPEADWMHLFYARFLESQDEVDAAWRSYVTVTELALNKGWAYGHLAAFQRRLGLLDQALHNYRRAASDKPKDALLRTEMAETYYEFGDEVNALEECETATTTDSGVYYVFAGCGGVFYSLGEYERAARSYERSLELRPDDAAVLLNLGQTYESSDKGAMAIGVYCRLLAYGDEMSEVSIRIANERLHTLGERAFDQENAAPSQQC